MESLLMGVVCLGLFGCATESRLFDQLSDRTSLTSNRIVVIASSFGPDGPATQYHFVMDKDGKSNGTLFFHDERAKEGSTTYFDAPPGVFEETLGKLEETQFFRMKSAYAKGPPSMTMGARKTSVEIHYHGRKHVVIQEGSAEIDEGFDKMWLFLGDVQKRSTVVRSEKSAPRQRNRTLERKGGTITGLSPAGTPTPEINAPTNSK